MLNRKRSLAILSLGLAVSLAPAVSFAGVSSANTGKLANLKPIRQLAKVNQSADLLFVLNGKKGHLIPNKNGGYTLTVKQTWPKVTYFSDRPVRKSGMVTLSRFIQVWHSGKNSFATNPPNVVVDAVTNTSGQSSDLTGEPFVLSNPKYNPHNHTVTFNANPITKGKQYKPTELSHVAIFFDGMHWNGGV